MENVNSEIFIGFCFNFWGLVYIFKANKSGTNDYYDYEQGQDFYGNDSCCGRCADDSGVLDACDCWQHPGLEQTVLHRGHCAPAAVPLLVPAV